MMNFLNSSVTWSELISLIGGWVIGRIIFICAESRLYKRAYKKWESSLTPEQIEIMSRD